MHEAINRTMESTAMVPPLHVLLLVSYCVRRRPRENEEKVPSENHPSPHSRANGSTKDEAAALDAVFGLCGQHADKRVLRRSSKGCFLEPTRRVPVVAGGGGGGTRARMGGDGMPVDLIRVACVRALGQDDGRRRLNGVVLGDGQLAGTSGRSIQRGEGERRKRTTSGPANSTDVKEFAAGSRKSYFQFFTLVHIAVLNVIHIDGSGSSPDFTSRNRSPAGYAFASARLGPIPPHTGSPILATKARTNYDAAPFRSTIDEQLDGYLQNPPLKRNPTLLPTKENQHYINPHSQTPLRETRYLQVQLAHKSPPLILFPGSCFLSFLMLKLSAHLHQLLFPSPLVGYAHLRRHGRDIDNETPNNLSSMSHSSSTTDERQTASPSPSENPTFLPKKNITPKARSREIGFKSDSPTPRRPPPLILFLSLLVARL
ncbi:hypothetical protein B0H13DRAFT_1903772 [Mycena leptocephala]|nr:hypothetical protein B0H13DRAFT_1903772 [Mycena leptocephala]